MNDPGACTSHHPIIYITDMYWHRQCLGSAHHASELCSAISALNRVNSGEYGTRLPDAVGVFQRNAIFDEEHLVHTQPSKHWSQELVDCFC
jgi:hypothetical protein